LHAETNSPLANEKRSKKRPNTSTIRKTFNIFSTTGSCTGTSHIIWKKIVLSSGVGRCFKGRSSEQRRFVTGENIIIIIIIIIISHKS
jgi:hypothetical protein